MVKTLKLPKSQRLGVNETKELIKKADTPVVVDNATTTDALLFKKIEDARVKTAKQLAKYKDDYILVTTKEELHQYISDCLNSDRKIIALDTETTGLDVYTVDIVGFSLQIAKHKAIYVPVNHRNPITKERYENQVSERDTTDELNRLKDARIIMHNANYDIRVLHRINVFLSCWWETMIMATLLNENEEHKLKKLHGKYVSHEDELSFGDLYDNPEIFMYSRPEDCFIYGAHDAKDTYELCEFQCSVIKKFHNTPRSLDRIYKLFRTIEMPVLGACIQMEDNGFTFDREWYEEINPTFTTELEKYQKECFDIISNQYQSKIDAWRLTDAANEKQIKSGNPAISHYTIRNGSLKEAKISLLYDGKPLSEFGKNKAKDTIFTIPAKTKMEADYANEKPLYMNVLDGKARLTQKCTVKYDKSLSEKLDNPVRITSPTQLAILLFDILHEKGLSKEKDRSTAQENLEFINTDFTKALLKYKEYDKLVNGFIRSIYDNLGADQKFRSKINQVGARTGRMSVSSDSGKQGASLQTIPSDRPDIRKLFKASTEEREVTIMDKVVLDATEEARLDDGEWWFAGELRVGDVIDGKPIKDIQKKDGIVTLIF